MNTEKVPSEEIAERIGRLADKADNMHAATLIPLAAEKHLPIMRASLIGLRDELRALHVELTGDDPWSI